MCLDGVPNECVTGEEAMFIAIGASALRIKCVCCFSGKEGSVIVGLRINEILEDVGSSPGRYVAAAAYESQPLSAYLMRR